MNSFVVVFAALILSVQGSSLRAGRQGWGASPPAAPGVAVDIAVDITASAAATGAGAADSTQDILAVATGGGWGGAPAEIDLSAYTSAAVGQDIDITQVAAVDLTQPGPTSSSLNLVSVDNYAIGDEALSANVAGDSAYLASHAADSASGTGQISAVATSNNSQQPGAGWSG